VKNTGVKSEELYNKKTS